MTTLEKLLRDAQLLVGKMKQNDTVAESITEHYQQLNNRIEATKKFQEVSLVAEEKNNHKQNLNLVLLPVSCIYDGILNLQSLSFAMLPWSKTPQDEFIIEIQGLENIENKFKNGKMEEEMKENPHIRDLENENKELRSFLDEHQAALELIMSKYRHHVNKHLSSHSITLSTDDYSNKYEILENRIDQINAMKNMMWKVLEMDEPSHSSSDELTQLQKEHSTLLQLLHISKSFGNNCIFSKDGVNSFDHSESSTCFEKDQINSFICPNASDK